eukprot:5922780-Amphidinium_carterae.1
MGIEAVQEHLPDMMAQLSRQRRVRDITCEFSDAAADAPASAAPARRRLSTISTTIPDERDQDTEEPSRSRRRLSVQEHFERIEQRTGTQPTEHPSSSSHQHMDTSADVQEAGEPPSASAPAASAGMASEVAESSYGTMREELSVRCQAYWAVCWDDPLRCQAYWAVCWDDPHGVNEQVSEEKLVAFVPAILSFMVVRRATDELDPSTLSKEDWDQFWPAVEKECRNLIDVNKGLDPLPVEESLKLRQLHPERIIQSRYHLKWKQVDEEKGVSFVPKARLILKGFQDPDILNLPSSVPSPAMSSINVALAVIAGYGWQAFQADFTQAFLQGKEVERFIKEVYGSIAGPSRWRESVVTEILRLGWSMCTTDPCVFVMRGLHPVSDISQKEKQRVAAVALGECEQVGAEQANNTQGNSQAVQFSPIDGILLLLTDDIIEAGEPRHRKAVQELLQTFKTGRYTSL